MNQLYKLRCLAVALFFLMALQTQAQQAPAGGITLTGTVVDSSTGKPLGFGSAALMIGRDSTVQATNTDEAGRFTLTNLHAGRYRLVLTYLGYSDFKRTVNLLQSMDLGNLRMGGGAQSLDEVEITGQLTPVKVKGDTTEFNAGAYKTNPDASGEDLVNKMPGLSTADGSVKAMGETVTQVTVDGKPFFGDDPMQTLRNLPADMVDKVQLLDQKSETSQLTGFDDGNRQKTLNIVTKANRRQGVFGKASANGGVDAQDNSQGRYSGMASVNLFDGPRRLTFIGQTNNVNQQNFQVQDLVGAMNGGGGRGGVGGRGQGGGGGGGGGGRGPGPIGNFLVGQQSGITATSAAGLNYSDQLAKNLEINGSYFYNRAANGADQFTNKAYIPASDSSQRFNEEGHDRSLNFNHRANARLEWKPDTNNTLIFRPRFSSQANTLNSTTDDTTRRGAALQSILRNDYSSQQNGINSNAEAVFRHRFSKLGRSVVVGVNGSANTSNGSTLRNTYSESFMGGAALPDSTRQRILTDTKTLGTGGSITYTEPLGKKTQLLALYQPDLQYRTADRDTRNVTGETETVDSSLSNKLTSSYLTQQAGLGARFNGGKVQAGGQVNYQRSDLNSRQEFISNTIKVNKSFDAFLPQFNLNYKLNANQSMRLLLSSSTQAPSATQLQTVVNTSNLLSLSTGNPNLRQTYTVNANGQYNLTKPSSNQLFMLMGIVSVVDDYIGNATYLARTDSAIQGGIVLPAGGQLTLPSNMGRQYTARSFANYGTPLKFIKSNLNLNLSYGYTSTPGLIRGHENRSNSNALGGGLTLSSNISENVDFTIGTSPSYTLVRNTLQTSGNYNYFNQSSRLNLRVIFWKGFTLSSQVTHTYYSGLSAGYNQNFVLWNATVGKKFGKAKEWEAQAIVFDLLNRNQSVQRTISDVYIQDTRTNVLRRYVMVGLTWTIRRFKGQKGQASQTDEEKEREQRFRNGPPVGMPPPGGGFGPPPGGPPPGGGF